MTERERIAGKKLRERSILNRSIRAFFDAREFIEIEAPILVPSPGLELHLDAFAVPTAKRRATSSPAPSTR